VKEILRAFGARDPPPNRQKAVTGRMLKDLVMASSDGRLETQHTADLIVGAFFFAMRSCEFVRTQRQGRTVPLELRNVTFRTETGREVAIDDPNLIQESEYVTITFVDQKNGVKRDRRTQRKTGIDLCPVRAWGKVCQRVMRTTGRQDNRQRVYSIRNEEGELVDVSSRRVATMLKNTCAVYGPVRNYGIQPWEIGTRSIRSGAAMALFMKNHSVEKIKILGRWSSDAFLVYIRPQVMEWTNIMAQDMAETEGFRDLNQRAHIEHNQEDNWRQGNSIQLPRFHLSH